MLERFLDKVDFESYDDFMQNFHIKDLPGFNFAYDVVDEWARIEPDRKALLWTNEAGDVAMCRTAIQAPAHHRWKRDFE